MAESGLRRGLVALVLLTAVVAAGAVLVAGGALVQDDDDADDSPENDTVAPENRTVDVERVNVTVELDPNDDLEEDLDYELAVVGNVSPLNDAANGTVDCTRDLCVLNGTIAPDAEGEELPRYELRGVVTSVAPSEGFTTHVNGTLEGDAIEGLGLGAYNVSAPNETDGDSNETVVRMDDDSGAETSAATIQTSDDASESGDESEAASGTDEASEEDSGSGDASEEDSESGDASEEDAATVRTDGGEPSESGSDGESAESASDGESDGASVSFDGCSVATVEGDAYAYEAGLRYYVQSGLDTSTYDNSEISTPATIDGNEVIGDARTTDVVIETVLVFDEDFQILTQVENPNYEDCVDKIEQQHEEAQK